MYKDKKSYYGQKAKTRKGTENFAKLMGNETIEESLRKKYNRNQDQKDSADMKGNDNNA